MGRRWVVQVDTSENGHPLYLRQFSFFAGQRGHPADEPEEAAVAIPYATKFKTKREATALAKARGYEDFTVMRTW
jgi:hypothetical protein